MSVHQDVQTAFAGGADAGSEEASFGEPRIGGARRVGGTSGPRRRAAPSARRLKREHDFALFKMLAGSYFEAPASDERHERMADRCGFFIAAGGAPHAPGAAQALDSRTFEVFYGARPVKNFHHLNQERLQVEWKRVTETGAALLYSQGDDGAVSAFLYPAFTDNLRQKEDAILLGRFLETEALTGRGLIEAHWLALRSYAEVTSIDGEPTLADRLRVAWMRSTCRTVRDGRIQPAEFGVQAQKVAGFGVAVAIAAGLLSLFGA